MTDETWVNFGHIKKVVWQDKNIKTPKQAYLEGLSTGLNVTSGKGSRLIITHARSEDGFVNEGDSAIRRKVHEFFKRNEIPTAAKVLHAINEDELLNFTVRTIQRVMNDLGFTFSKRNRVSMLIEREDIQLWKRRYLWEIRRYHSEGCPIYYTDETWVNFGHTKNVWQDKNIKTPKQAYLKGLSTGLNAP